MGNTKGTRRANREGSGPWKLADGRIRYDVYVGAGQPYKSVYARRTSDLWDKVRLVRRRLERGRLPANGKLTVAAYLERWLPGVLAEVSPATYISYELHVRAYLVPGIGDVLLDRLGPDHLRALRARLLAQPRRRGEGNLSTATVQRIFATLSRALADAERDGGLIDRNPMRQVRAPKVEHPEVRPLTIEQARRLLAAIRGDRLEPLIRLTLSYGMRRGEVLGVRWSDLELAEDGAGRLSITHQLRLQPAPLRGGGDRYELRPLKTGDRGRRTLFLPEALVEVLDRHRRRQYEERLAAGTVWRNKRDLIFTTTTGTPLAGDTVTKRFQALLEGAGLPTMPFHHLRHSAATILLAQGVPLTTVRDVLGHSTYAMTADLYAHVVPALPEEAARRMEAALESDVLEQLGEQLALFDQPSEPLSEPLSAAGRSGIGRDR